MLDDFYSVIWGHLRRAVHDRKSPFRNPVLASLKDSTPDQRTIVLRDVEQETWSFWFHTRADSAKINQLTASKESSLLFYSARHKLQLRFTGETAVYKGEEADFLWEQAGPGEKRLYCLETAPGQKIAEPSSFPPFQEINEADFKEGRARFAGLKFTAVALDALELGRDQHRRAFFTSSERYWLQP